MYLGRHVGPAASGAKAQEEKADRPPQLTALTVARREGRERGTHAREGVLANKGAPAHG
jgi:hypothetical protein